MGLRSCKNEAMKLFVHELRVRFADTDAMGIVHHARYFEYFEAARVAMLAEKGLPYTRLIEMGYHLPLIEVQASYKVPAKFDDVLKIEAQLQPMEGIRLKILYKVWRGEELLAAGRTGHVFIDDKGRPVRPPEAFLQIL